MGAVHDVSYVQAEPDTRNKPNDSSDVLNVDRDIYCSREDEELFDNSDVIDADKDVSREETLTTT